MRNAELRLVLLLGCVVVAATFMQELLTTYIPEGARTLPSGKPERWNEEQKTRFHWVASELAREYMIDCNMSLAMERLGWELPDGAKERYAFVSKAKNNFLVQHYIRKRIKSFKEDEQVLNEHTLAYKAWELAHTPDTVFGSEAGNRAKGIDMLAKMMGAYAAKKVDVNHTGVVLVPNSMSIDEFEAKALEQQKALEEKIDEVIDI